MTLLITLVTAQTIYQSADYRLVDLDAGQELTSSSCKLISLQYEGWHGFIAYTGIGSWKRRDTREFVLDWLRDFSSGNPHEAVERIRREGTLWLNEIYIARRKRYPHTFILTAFHEGSPRVWVISNFENAYEIRGRAGNELATTTRQFSDGIGVVVGGLKEVVKRQARNQLKRQARETPDDPARLRRLLSKINAESAKHAKTFVSSDCSVMSYRSDGRGQYDAEGKIDVRSVMFGMLSPSREELTQMMRKSLNDPNFELGALKGMVTAGSGKRVPFAKCEPRIVVPPGANGFKVREVSFDEPVSAGADDVNDPGYVVGHASPTDRPDVTYSWIEPALIVSGVVDEGARTVRINAINSEGQLVIQKGLLDNTTHGVRWAAGRETRLEPYLPGADTSAASINNAGTVVGWVSIDPAIKGQASQRPAAWKTDKLIQYPNFQADWGYASDVSDSDEVVVVTYVGNRTHAYLWDLKDGTTTPIPGRLGVIPIAISANGTVLGNLNLSNGSSVALTAGKGREWQALGTPPGYYATAINAGLEVVGYQSRDGYARPWLRRVSGEIIWLPYFEFHGCQPRAINAAGVIVGSAGTDHGSHALTWSVSGLADKT